jgi:hypothetical protein
VLAHDERAHHEPDHAHRAAAAIAIVLQAWRKRPRAWARWDSSPPEPSLGNHEGRIRPRRTTGDRWRGASASSPQRHTATSRLLWPAAALKRKRPPDDKPGGLVVSSDERLALPPQQLPATA